MFKGLKSKLEDEAKRLQATVSQYSENIAQQVRSGVNDVGNDTSGHSRRLFTSGTVRNPLLHSPNEYANDFDTAQNEQNPNGSALMQEVPEQDLFDQSRQRRISSGSFESESSLNNLFAAIPGMIISSHRLSTITSDVESESIATSSQFQSASKEQISTVLHKLQGRAASYKDKYRGLIKIYNELVRENEKYRETKEAEAKEDGKVKELQELVEKCRLNMIEKKEKIRELTDENEKLKKNIEMSLDEQEISDLAVRRVTAEWKGRVDCLEEEWSKRLSDSEEAGTLAIAKVKAEMHRALEEKDVELQAARARCKVLELGGLDVQRQINELKAAVDALENEKADMVEKLSEAKQQGVKAVRCEEEEKRQELKKEMERRRAEEKEEDERLFQEMIVKNNEQWALKFKEQEEQMQLAIEEREMQKVAAVMEHDRKNENLGVQVEQLTAEKLHLKSVLDDMKERHRQQMDELCASIEASKERHQQEINELKKRQEEIIAVLKEDFEAATKSNKQLKDELEELSSNKQKEVEEVENRNRELLNELAIGRQNVDDLKKQHKYDMDIIRSKMSVLEKNYEETLKNNDFVKQELIQKNGELGELKQRLTELSQALSNKGKKMEELYGSLEQKTATIMNLESEKEILSAELASTRELSKIHQHLQHQLKAAQMERDEAEKKYLEMEERVQKAMEELEVDRRILHQEKEELEKKKQNSHQWIEAKMTKSEAKEMKYMMEQAQEQAEKVTNDLDEKVASLIGENEQLKNQIVYQLEKIKKLENEKEALVKELEEIKKKPIIIYRVVPANGEITNHFSKSTGRTDEIKPKFKNKAMNFILSVKVAFRVTGVKKMGLASVVNVSRHDLVPLNDVELTKSCLFGNEELPAVSADSLGRKDEAPEELQDKLNFAEEERLSYLAKMEVLERRVRESEEEKSNMMKEMEDVRVSRESLMKRIKEMEGNVRKISKNDLEMDKLENDRRDQVDETDNLRSALLIAEKEIKEKSSKLHEFIKKNGELEAMNEKLRIEFLQKENVVGELQKKIKEQEMKENGDLESLKKSLEEERRRRVILENELTEMKNELQERKNNEEFLENKLSKKREDAEEEQKIRNQYALALKSANDSLEEAQKQLADLDLVRIEKDRVFAELSLAKEDYEKVIQQLKQENERRTEEIKKKAEQKLLKMKKQFEMDGKTAKAELLLQIDGMRSEIAERDLEIEEKKLNISSLEEKLFDKGENEKIMNDLRASIEMMSNERDEKSSKCAEMEVELTSMHRTIEEAKEQLESQNKQNASLQNELENLKTENERLRGSHCFIKPKVESERQRLLRDFQKEIKQLYHDLNERTQQLDDAQSKLKELSIKKTENQDEVDIACQKNEQEKCFMTNTNFVEQADYEELCALREQVAQYQKQLENIKEAHKKEITLLCGKGCCTEHFNVIGLESITNGSVSYLRNVLYRYMNERETLGRESITLARVIATVARFTHEQMNAVVAKEEQRNHGWVGGTVQGLISSAANLSSR
uniref:GRIP domain-containing protein n=1 Tax=Setaria digitata TaxID=48799 RepID=A0A915Q2U6_9BILA